MLLGIFRHDVNGSTSDKRVQVSKIWKTISLILNSHERLNLFHGVHGFAFDILYCMVIHISGICQKIQIAQALKRKVNS